MSTCTDKQKTERFLDAEIKRDVWQNVNDLIQSLDANHDIRHGRYGRALDRLIDGRPDYETATRESLQIMQALNRLINGRIDYETAARESLQIVVDDHGAEWALPADASVPESNYWEKLEKLPDAVRVDGDWQDICYGFEINTDDYHVKSRSYWIVSGWLGKKLAERGEIVEKVYGMTVWGRMANWQTILKDVAREALDI